MKPSKHGEVQDNRESVLVLAPIGRDAELIARALGEARIQATLCRNTAELSAAVEAGAGAALVAEEALSDGALGTLARALAQQPEWSDLPLLILTQPGPTSITTWLTIGDLEPIGYATILERPLRPMTLVSAIQRVLRSRRRQYQVRDYLAERAERERTLRRLMRRERARREELQILFDHAPVGIAVAEDASGEVIRVNVHGAELLGVAPGANVSLSLDNRQTVGLQPSRDGQPVPPEELPTQRAMETGRPVLGQEYDIARADGVTMVVQEHAAPLFSEDGNVRGAISAFADVTRQRQAERVLRESEEHFRTLVESLPHIVWTTTPDGLTEYVSPRFGEYIGRDGVMPSGEWSQHVHPEDRGPLQQAWDTAVSAAQVFELECRLRGADRAHRWFLLKCVPLKDATGRVRRWFVTATDVHERHELDEQRRTLLRRERVARAEAERVSRMKDEFLATVSHELRTPLTAILGWVQMLRRGTLDEADAREALATIERNARAQRSIIEDLLETSRMISGKIRLNLERVDLCEVAAAALDSVRPSAEAKQLEIVDHLHGPVLLRADPNRLQQAIWNLLSNAAKFTPSGGRIDLSVRQLDENAEVSVADTGKGLQLDETSVIFERFRQIDDTRTREHGGLGLGLSIVKQLAELHGGTVTVRSPGLGQGATFTIRLPRVATPDPEAVADDVHSHAPRGAPEPANVLAGLTILILDPGMSVRLLAGRLLERNGATTLSAGTAAEALAQVRRAQPSAVIGDLGARGGEALRFIRALREQEEGRRIPTIALLARGDVQAAEVAHDSGFDQVLTKPIESAELLRVMQAVIDDRLDGNPEPPE